MGLTLNELVSLQTKEDLLAQLFLALQGVGFVAKTGIGSGNVTTEGVAAGAASVRLKVSTAGERGSGAFRLSTDAGATYGSPVTIPSNGVYVVGTTGLTVTFNTGPSGSGTSFALNDVFAIELTVPTLPVTAWQPGSTPLTLVELFAQGLENFAATIQRVAQGGFLFEATGDWMDLVLENVYALTRNAGATTVGNFVLTDTANAGPFTISAGQVWAGTVGGLRWTNITGGVLPQGLSLTLSFRAESPGSAYNVGAGTVSVLFTSLAGVTVSNPNPVGGSWITTPGADRETDAQAAIRAISRWPALGIGVASDAYDLWVKTASSSVTQTYVREDPATPGNVQVYLAGNGGAVDGAVVAAVQAYVDPRAPLTTIAVVASATAVPITVAGTLYVTTGNAVAAAAAVDDNIGAYFNSGTNSIDEELPGVGIAGTAYTSAIVEQAMLAPGARNFVLSTPASDTVLAAGEVFELTQNITIVEV